MHPYLEIYCKIYLAPTLAKYILYNYLPHLN